MFLNTRIDVQSGDIGSSWPLVGNKSTFFLFNSYGVTNTAKIYGFVNNNNNEIELILARSAISKLSKVIAIPLSCHMVV